MRLRKAGAQLMDFILYAAGEVPAGLPHDGLHGMREVQGLGQAPGHR